MSVQPNEPVDPEFLETAVIREMPPEQVPLQHYLQKYTAILEQEGVEELMINQPGELFVERAGKGIERIIDESITYQGLRSLAQLIATFSKQALNETDTLLGASLPTGERVQIVLPPSCEEGKVCFAIRKPSTADHTLSSLAELGVFKQVREPATGYSEVDRQLLEFRKQQRFVEFFTLAVQSAKNIVVSGGTSSGKTTFANAMLKNIPDHERIITIEDVREVNVSQPNKVHLLASKGGTSTAKAGVGELFGACLRLRPDRIMLSEIRGAEAYDFLNSVTSGHPGSITTVHADSVHLAIQRLARYVGDHESGRNIDDREGYIRNSVDIIVQVQKDLKTGWRGVTDIYFAPDAQDL